MTRDEAHAELARLAATVFEADPDQAAVRLLERIAGHEAPEELRAELAELGARVQLWLVKVTRGGPAEGDTLALLEAHGEGTR